MDNCMSAEVEKTNNSLTIHIKVGSSAGGHAGCLPVLEQAPSSSSDIPAGTGKLEEEAESKAQPPVPVGPPGTEKAEMQADHLGESRKSSSVTGDFRSTSIILTEKGGRPARCYKGVGRHPPLQGGYRLLFYLEQTFHYPVTLMSAMFDTGCVLIGSRALEFFLPGAAGPDSAWDFYVPGYKESVADMIDALARCGVIWDLKGDATARELVEKGCVIVSRKSLQAMASWMRHVSHESAADLMGKELCNIIETFQSLRKNNQQTIQAYKVTLNSQGQVQVEADASASTADDRWCYEGPYGDSLSILHGHIKTPRGVDKVKLIIGCHGSGIKSCMSFIETFYASHVQCFVGGWCAGHMYYHQAKKRESTLWDLHPNQQVDKVNLAVEKYQKRGYTFTPVQTPPLVYTFNSEPAFLEDYGDYYMQFISPSKHKILLSWLEERRANLRSISWVDHTGRVSIFSMKPCQKREKTFALGADLSCQKQYRLADIVAEGNERGTLLRDDRFRSSVSRSLQGEYWGMPEAARSGTVWDSLHYATPFSWFL